MIVLYANAGNGVGFGHIFRLLPILQKLQVENLPVCMKVPLPESILKNLGLKDVESIKPGLKPVSSFLTDKKPGIFFFDSYDQPNSLIKTVLSRDYVVLCFDDHYRIKESVHTIINPALDAKPERYAHISRHSLLGPNYFPLLEEFQIVREKLNIRPMIQKIVVAMGGDDTEGALSKILETLLNEINNTTIVDVYGNNMPDIVHPMLNKIGWLHQTELIKRLGEYDIAILAGGSMLQQCACLGLPVISWPQHSRQAKHAKSWEEKGTLMVVDNIIEFKSIYKKINNVDVRKSMSQAGRKSVDGLGVKRLVAHLKNSIN